MILAGMIGKARALVHRLATLFMTTNCYARFRAVAQGAMAGKLLLPFALLSNELFAALLLPFVRKPGICTQFVNLEKSFLLRQVDFCRFSHLPCSLPFHQKYLVGALMPTLGRSQPSAWRAGGDGRVIMDVSLCVVPYGDVENVHCWFVQFEKFAVHIQWRLQRHRGPCPGSCRRLPAAVVQEGKKLNNLEIGTVVPGQENSDSDGPSVQ